MNNLLQIQRYGEWDLNNDIKFWFNQQSIASSLWVGTAHGKANDSLQKQASNLLNKPDVFSCASYIHFL